MDKFPMFERTKRKNEYQNTAIVTLGLVIIKFTLTFIPCMYMADHIVDNDILAFVMVMGLLFIIESTEIAKHAAWKRFQEKAKAYEELPEINP